MNKRELAVAVADKMNCTVASAAGIVDAVVDTIIDTLGHGEEVRLVGFGAFEVSHRTAHECKNPKDGTVMTVPERNVPVFRAGKRFREELNK